ncbi:hypothetical protein [Bifidobacterium jacchi]|uniref:hypothetical protein n=1 Tax=Bifidobacterium jacchi TaxID=2490545 RepID=UPI00158811C4|nr:hypothetical protein [Bifidobacterium jacchi]
MARPLIEVRVFGYAGFSLGMLILLRASGGVLGLNFLLPILLQRAFVAYAYSRRISGILGFRL